MYAFLTSIATVAAYAHGAAAWGNLGHETVGYVAQAFLAPKALSFVQSSLGSTYNKSLGVAATWADSVKYTSAYTWSAPYHFVDANDSPLDGSCSVEQSRDCSSGTCILSAIANYTTRIAETSLSATQRQEALKFLDTGMVEKNIDDNHGGEVQTYAADLINEIKNGAYASDTDDWLSCTSTTEPASKRFFSARPPTIEAEVKQLLAGGADELERRSTITPLECPLVWARESNAYCCSTVFSYTSGEDLCTSSYFTNAVPVSIIHGWQIDLQLAKQGYRLAAWLNVIFDGETDLP
uniref:Nuclease Le1 n=1 Tax=Ganoderma boninense TaxID=34458 RepID=A0A5K1JZ23_9APHY|nr:Uncharacterized protein [Ganoderma boninense]